MKKEIIIKECFYVSLLELSRYARKKGKKLADLSQDEVNQFLI